MLKPRSDWHLVVLLMHINEACFVDTGSHGVHYADALASCVSTLDKKRPYTGEEGDLGHGVVFTENHSIAFDVFNPASTEFSFYTAKLVWKVLLTYRLEQGYHRLPYKASSTPACCKRQELPHVDKVKWDAPSPRLGAVIG